MSVIITSTTDSAENVLAATGGTKPAEAKTEETTSESVEETQTDETTEASETSIDESEASTDEESEEIKDEDESKEEDKKPKKLKGFKKRIDKLNRRLTEEQQKAEYWRQEALKRPGGQEPQQKEAPNKDLVPAGKPKASEFDTHEAFVEALTDWKVEQKENERELKQKEAQFKTEQQKQLQAFNEKALEFKKEHDDFDEVLAEGGDASYAINDAILTSDLGPAIAYELAQDKELLNRLNRLSAVAVGREIAKIEARLSKSSDESTDSKKQTKAPPPIKPVGKSSAGSVKKSIYDQDLPYAEWERLRNEQLRRKA